MAQPSRAVAVTRDSWLRLLPALIANAADIPHLEPQRLRLEVVTTEVGDLLTQQAALAATRQDVSKRLQALVVEGRQLTTFLRVGVKQRYGTRSEKLSAFHLQPFRGRKVKSAEGEEESPVEVPASPASA